jgi:hypothetical protein
LIWIGRLSQPGLKEPELLTFDFAHPRTLPALAGPHQGGKDELQIALLAETPRHDSGWTYTMSLAPMGLGPSRQERCPRIG